MLRLFKSTLNINTRNVFSGRAMSTATTAADSVGEAAAPLNSQPIVIQTTKENIAQSPLKMRFLVMLARDKWMPDALAQMKFTPKHRSEEITQMLKRTCVLAMNNHNAMPEQLRVKEIFVTKGLSRKKVRFQGRGRTGVGMIRKTHVTLKTEIIDFPAMIAAAKSDTMKKKWIEREKLVLRLQEQGRAVPRVGFKFRKRQHRKQEREARAGGGNM